MIQTILWLVAVIAAIWVIYDVLTNNKKVSQTSKVIWIICAVIFNIITAIVYFFVYKMK